MFGKKNRKFLNYYYYIAYHSLVFVIYTFFTDFIHVAVKFDL